MRVYGAPVEGKRINLTDRVSIQVPYGVVYSKDEDGNYTLTKYKYTPEGYRDGVFTVNDETEIRWQISSIKQQAEMNFQSDTGVFDPAEMRNVMRTSMESLAQSMVREDNSSKEVYEPGSSTHVEETQGGFTLRSQISMNAAGGSYQLLDLPGLRAAAMAKKGVQIFGMTLYFTYLFLCAGDENGAPVLSATLKATDGDFDFYKKNLTPLLSTVEYRGGRTAVQRTGSVPAAGAPAPVVPKWPDANKVTAQMDFSKGRRLEAGEFSILLPEGMCASGDISPETRYWTCIPEAVDFDDAEWQEHSAVKLSVQTGQRHPGISDPLDSEAGERQVRELLQIMTVSQPGTSDSTVGQIRFLARGADYAVCYEDLGETEIDVSFRYYLFSHRFLYPGTYIGWKAGLENPQAQHRQILEKWLATVRCEGGAEAEQVRYGRQRFGKYAGENGKLDAVTVAQLFSGDVLFFNEGDFLEEPDGSHDYKNLHYNAMKQEEHPEIAANLSDFTLEIRELLLALDKVPELRVPREKLHKKLLPLLFNDFAVPLTGMTVMNLLAHHMLFIQPDAAQPDTYTVVLDRNFVAGIPGAYRYTAAFLRQLRQYNGKTGAFTVTFTTAMNFDTPIEGALLPVEGAEAIRDGYQLSVDGSGAVTEEVTSGPEEQPEPQSIPELERSLPADFTAAMRAFAKDIVRDMAGLRQTLLTSSYDGYQNTEDVLSRVMNQSGDYGLGWGIYNFYNIFTIGRNHDAYEYRNPQAEEFHRQERVCYRLDERYENDSAEDPDFRPDAFPKQLAVRITGITEEDVYGDLLRQAANYRQKGYTIVNAQAEREAERLRKQAEELKTVPFDRVSAVPVSGSTFVLTGEFRHLKNDREAIKARITARGGRVTGAVSGKTDYVVVGGLGGFGDRKLEQVREQRAKGKTVKIIREADLFQALEGGRTPSVKKPADPTPPADQRVQIRQVQPRGDESMRFQISVNMDDFLDGSASVEEDRSRRKKESGSTPASGQRAASSSASHQKARQVPQNYIDEQLQEINKKRAQADAQYEQEAQKVKADFAAKRQAVRASLSGLMAQRDRCSKERSEAGFFQFSQKKQLQQQLTDLNQQIQAAQAQKEELNWKEANELRALNHRIRGKVAEEAKVLSYYALEEGRNQTEEGVYYAVLSALSEEPITKAELEMRLTRQLGNNWQSSQLYGALRNRFIRRCDKGYYF